MSIALEAGPSAPQRDVAALITDNVVAHAPFTVISADPCYTSTDTCRASMGDRDVVEGTTDRQSG